MIPLVFFCVAWIEGGLLCRQGADGGDYRIVPAGYELTLDGTLAVTKVAEPVEQKLPEGVLMALVGL